MTDHAKGRETVYANMARIQKLAPGVMKSFMALHEKACEDGALSPKMKELISLGIAIAVHCEGCIDCHVYDALAAGATAEEIGETVGVAILMGGGPATVYGGKALDALEQFQAAEG